MQDQCTMGPGTRYLRSVLLIEPSAFLSPPSTQPCALVTLYKGRLVQAPQHLSVALGSALHSTTKRMGIEVGTPTRGWWQL